MLRALLLPLLLPQLPDFASLYPGELLAALAYGTVKDLKELCQGLQQLWDCPFLLPAE